MCPVCGTHIIRLGATEAHASLDRGALIAQAKEASRERPQEPEVQSSENLSGTAASAPARERPKRRPAAGARSKRLGREKGSTSPSPSATGVGKLVIVESPAKARTVGKLLGAGYRVRASVGHIRDAGFTISPLLRKKINTKNLSAGRVQSVAVRLVVEAVERRLTHWMEPNS